MHAACTAQSKQGVIVELGEVGQEQLLSVADCNMDSGLQRFSVIVICPMHRSMCLIYISITQSLSLIVLDCPTEHATCAAADLGVFVRKAGY